MTDLKQFISVAGVTTPEQAEAISEHYHFVVGQQYGKHALKAPELAIGVLANSQTLHNERSNWAPNRYPPLSDVSDIFAKTVGNCVLHYATSNREGIFKELAHIDRYHQEIDGYQINKSWPDPDELADFHSRHRGNFVVISVTRKAYEASGARPELLAKECGLYEGLASHVLLDWSGGRGESLKVEEVLPILGVLRQELEGKLRLAVAGGWCAETLRNLAPLLKVDPTLSICAEGRLRDENDQLDIEKANKYTEAALLIMRESVATLV